MRGAAARMLAVLSVPRAASAQLPAGMLGTWSPTETPQAILGPMSMPATSLQAARDPASGDFWIAGPLAGQMFRIEDPQMQYCFSESQFGLPVSVSEQAPFIVGSADDTQVTFCWRGAPMATHKANCSGCDCASIALTLTGPNTLEFLFHMSPPVVHVHIRLNRTGPPPPMSTMVQKLGNATCEFNNHTGPLSPKKKGPMCAMRVPPDAAQWPRLPAAPAGFKNNCVKFNGVNKAVEPQNTHIPDIRFQYSMSETPCSPCSIQYSVSAAIGEGEYIAFGFKGPAWLQALPGWNISRPGYFGMKSDEDDAMVVGYAGVAGGGCAREMRAEDYVGEPTDATGSHAFTNLSVARAGGRTVLRFTSVRDDPSLERGESIGGSIKGTRIMWAVGDVDGDGCDAGVGFHALRRGVSPLHWFFQHLPCVFDPVELA